MPRKSSVDGVSSLLHFVQRVFGGRPRPERARRSATRRRLWLEPLETRSLMATDLGEITGRVFLDDTGNGFTAGEQVVGASVQLYTDNGDNVFNAGTDTLTATDTTDANGLYDFTGRTAGNYFVRQPAQVVGATSLANVVSSMITISAAEAQGITGTTIDTFATVGPNVTAAFPVGTTDSASLAALEALGGERDLFVELTAGGAGDSVSFSGGASQLNFNPTFTARGRYVSVWDGVDGASAVAANGLNGLDLTTVGTINSIRMLVGVDQLGATVQFRLHSSAGNVSTSTAIAIPVGAPSELIIPFSSFTLTSGTGGSFANAGALEMEFVTTTDATDGQVTLIGLIGPTVKTQNFDNPADLAITKTASNATPAIGQNVTFTITITNAGPGDANNVAVTDQLPAGLTFVSATPSQGTYVSGTGLWTIGTIAVGTSKTLSIVATVANAGAKINAATISATDNFDSNPANNSSNVTVTPPQIDLSVTKIASNTTPNVGQNVTFTVTVANAAGRDNATGVTVTDALPAGLTFVSATPSGTTTFNSGTGLWTVGNLNSGASATLAIVATVATSGAKINTAQVTAANPTDVDSTPNNSLAAEDDQASVTITPPVIDLSITKTASSATPNVGQNVTFTVTVTNAAGLDNATGVQVTDVLPAGLTFVSATPSVPTTFNSGTGVWTVGNLNAGASATLTLVATVTTSGTKINVAEVTAADQFDRDSTPNNGATTEDDRATATVTPPVIDLSLSKTVDDNTPDRNQNVTFTLTVANAAGRDNATGVTVSDLLPAGLTFVSATPSGTTTFSNGTGVWTVGNLNTGANATLSIVATVTSSATIVNVAEVSAAAQFDIDSTPNNGATIEDDRATVTLTPNIVDVSLTKTVNNSTPLTGQNVTFTLTAANAGPATATNVQVTDVLPAGLTFVSSTPSGNTTFNSGTGVWTIGTLNSGANATLQVVATMSTNASKTNTAQVTAADQFDPDSTPNNSAAGEDDQSSVPLTGQRLSKRLFLAE